jgi:glycosyltransferase involved in cell wall biosynthesis
VTARTLIVIGDAADDITDETTAPGRDYRALADELDADILDAGILGSRRGRMLDGVALARAAAARSARYASVYCDSEHIGVPLAFLLGRRRSRPRLSMIAHYLTPLKKRLLIRALRAPRGIDAVIVHTRAQAERAVDLGFDPSHVALVPYQVDPCFWTPDRSLPLTHIASAGQEFRDYLTLMRAVDGLSLNVEIAAGSHWSTRTKNFAASDIPANVSVRRRPYAELRAMYAGARFVVVPLQDVDFQAGIITILEAMAMGKAVVVSRTQGQTGTVTGPLMQDGGLHDIGEHAWNEATGLYVPPGDAASLRAAIAYLDERPDVAARMGAAGRAHVEAALSLEHFVERISQLIAPQSADEPRRVHA